MLDEVRRDLKREARLAGAAGPGEREQAHVRAGEERVDLGELTLAPDERLVGAGRFVGRFSSVLSGGNSAGRPSISSW